MILQTRCYVFFSTNSICKIYKNNDDNNTNIWTINIIFGVRRPWIGLYRMCQTWHCFYFITRALRVCDCEINCYNFQSHEIEYFISMSKQFQWNYNGLPWLYQKGTRMGLYEYLDVDCIFAWGFFLYTYLCFLFNCYFLISNWFIDLLRYCLNCFIFSTLPDFECVYSWIWYRFLMSSFGSVIYSTH